MLRQVVNEIWVVDEDKSVTVFEDEFDDYRELLEQQVIIALARAHARTHVRTHARTHARTQVKEFSEKAQIPKAMLE